jgi:hypothetical protein
MFDPESALIVRQRFISPGLGPDAAVTEEAFSDYRDVNGLKVAFRATVYRNGAAVLERVLRSFEFNLPLASTLFTKPS